MKPSGFASGFQSMNDFKDCVSGDPSKTWGVFLYLNSSIIAFL
jgi:hypothetical protein